MMPIVCKNVIPKEKRDSYLFDKLLKEKNVIIKKRSLEALYRLIENNFKFNMTQEMIDTVEKHRIDNNTLLAFINECCIPADPNGVKTKKSIFMECYKNWCKINNNNKGIMSGQNVRAILENEYDEKFIKSNGIFYLTKLVIPPDIQEQLGIYEKSNYKIKED